MRHKRNRNSWSMRLRLTKVLPIAAVVVAIVLGWCHAYSRTFWGAWQTPVYYSGDSYIYLFFQKLAQSDTTWPWFSNQPQSDLAFPMGAYLQDMVHTDNVLIYLAAQPGRWVGLFMWSNIAVLLAHVLAGLALYFVARQLKIDRWIAVAVAVAFGLSNYGYSRNISHFTLTYYWIFPIVVYICWRLFVIRPSAIRMPLIAGVLGFGVLIGLHMPYYAVLTAIFFGLTAILSAWRYGWRSAILPIGCASIIGATLVAASAATQMLWRKIGANPDAYFRGAADTERYAFKPIELFLPHAHPIEAWNQLFHRYVSWTVINGEIMSPFLGLLGIFGILLLALTIGLALVKRRRFGWGFPVVLLFVAFSFGTIGGVNSLLGLFDIGTLRASNRFSVVILSIALLFLGRVVTVALRRQNQFVRIAVGGVLCAITLWEGGHVRITTEQARIDRRAIQADERFYAKLAEVAGPKAGIFELPVVGYATGFNGVDHAMHFVPKLFQPDFRISHGSRNGRGRNEWQYMTEMQPAASQANILMDLGFNVVLIQRAFFPDRGAAVIESFGKVPGLKRVDHPQDRAVAFILPQASQPSPLSPPDYIAKLSTYEFPFRSLNTVVGEITDKGFASKGPDGCLQFGPYIDLPQGTYRATWYGRMNEPGGSVIIEAAHRGNPRVLAQREIELPAVASTDDDHRLFELTFSDAIDLKGLEVRAHVRKNARITIDRVVIQRVP